MFVIVAATLWGVDGIILRPGLYTLPVSLVVMIESTIITLILTPFFRKQFFHLKTLKGKDWLAFIGVAVAGGAIGTMSITKALFYVNYVNLSIVILIQKLQPVFAILLAALVLKERPPKQFYGWAVMALIGALLMTFGANLPQLDTGDKTPEAALFALLAAAGFGASTVLSKRALRNIGHELGAYIRFLFTALVMSFITLITANIRQVEQITGDQAGIFLIIAFATGGPAIFLYYNGLKRISASVATICELSFPLTAVLLEYLVRGHLLEPMQWLGVLVLFAAIIRVSRLHTPSLSYS